MYRLISFLSRYRNAILFVVLEFIAFRLVVTYNDYQRVRFGDQMIEVGGAVQSIRAGVRDFQRRALEYDDRVADIDSLMVTVDSLRSLVAKFQLQQMNDSLDQYRDSSERLQWQESYAYHPCRVIRNTVNRNYNYLTLDKGRADGIRADMGVVSPEGIVGRVIAVSEHYSLALSALNLSFKVTLKTLPEEDEQGSIGVYEWNGLDPRFADLTYVPESVELIEDVTQVVTSGFSYIFPAGYPVGVVREVTSNQEDGFLNARIELATDFHRLGTVFIVEAEHQPELDSLYQAIPAP